jgi:hypothetical protein
LTIVVLLVLAGIWGAVLVPPLLRGRAEGRPADSIVDFRRQLSVLRRTSPLASSQASASALADVAQRSFAMSAMSAGPVGVGATVGPASAARRLRTQRRRREVFFSLLGGVAGTLLLGLIPGLHAVLMVNVLVDIAFAGYLFALLRFRNLAAEREMKLRFLPQPRRIEPALLLRRSAN